MGKIFYKGVDYSSPTSSGVSGVKGNKETVYRVGNVNITPENVGALAENGDSKDNTVTFTSNDTSTSDAWTDVAVLATGEKHSSLFNKISTMFKNIRYIYTHFIKSENILETLEEISANTTSGKVAGALAVKELNNNLTVVEEQRLSTIFYSNEFVIYVYRIGKLCYTKITFIGNPPNINTDYVLDIVLPDKFIPITQIVMPVIGHIVGGYIGEFGYISIGTTGKIGINFNTNQRREWVCQTCYLCKN